MVRQKRVGSRPKTETTLKLKNRKGEEVPARHWKEWSLCQKKSGEYGVKKCLRKKDETRSFKCYRQIK